MQRMLMLEAGELEALAPELRVQSKLLKRLSGCA